MSLPLTLEIYMHKAQTALAGAQLLLGAGDTEGACNRACYAMFDAAHAALFALGVENPASPIKTHNRLIGQPGRCGMGA